MKIKYFNVIFYFVLFNLCFSGCTAPPFTPSKEYITFNIKDVIIGGTNNFILKDGFDTSLINMFEFKITEIFYPYEFILSEGLNLNVIKNTLEFASRSQLDTDYTYKVNLNKVKEDTHEINGETKSVYAFNLYDYSFTRLFIKDERFFGQEVYKFNYHESAEIPGDNAFKTLTLKTNTRNDIVLKYDLYGSAYYNGIIDFKFFNEQTFYENRYLSMLFNYNAEWDNLSKNTKNYSNFTNKSINILFIADGYSSSSVSLFISDVRDNLMMEIQNSNIKTNWDEINILALQTISLEDKYNSYNICGINYANPYGDIEQIKKIIQTSFFGSPIYINDSNGLTNTNIDVIIIVSTEIGSSYMTTDSTYPFIKNKEDVKQQVHIICISAYRYLPHGKSLTEHLKSALHGLYND
ncbi:hypothetical protein [Treponema sp. R80B11-R83G3]